MLKQCKLIIYRAYSAARGTLGDRGPGGQARQGAVGAWLAAAGITAGSIWRGMRKGDHIVYDRPGMSSQAIWRVVTDYAGDLGYDSLAPHDLRRTAAKLMLAGGAKLEQISLVLGHSSLEVTKKYLGVDLDLQNAATDKIGLAIKARQKRLPEA